MMKKYIIICTALILLIVAPVESRMTILHLAGQIQSEAPPTCNTSNIVLFWRVEDEDLQGDCTGSGAPYACCSAANAGTCDYHALSGTNGTLSGATISASADKYGVYGLYSTGGYSYWYMATPSYTIDEEARIGFWVKINTWVSAAKLFGIYIDADNYIRIGMVGTSSSDIELACYWEDDNITRTTFSTTTANMATGTWYFVELAYKYSTNYREFFVSGVSKGTDSNTIDRFTSAVANIAVGNVHSYAADLYIDNVIISSNSTDDLYTVCKDETEWPE